jgi:hypothetical protein
VIAGERLSVQGVPPFECDDAMDGMCTFDGFGERLLEPRHTRTRVNGGDSGYEETIGSTRCGMGRETG